MNKNETLYAGLVLFMLTMLPGGCAYFQPTERIAAFHDAEFKNVKFRQLVVWADIVELDRRKLVEEYLAEELRLWQVQGYQSAQYIPPTREWAEEQVHDIFRQRAFDGILHITSVERGVNEGYQPMTSKTTVDRETVTKEDSTKSTETETVTTQVDGGYTYYVPWQRYHIRLVDAATGKTAWLGVNTIRGDDEGAIMTFAEEVAEQLLYDKVVLAAGE